MRYGSLEHKYAAPIAHALTDDAAFKEWVLSKSEFHEFSDARILHKEMALHRQNSSAEWWRFHFTEKSRCLGCSGKETDLLTIFESKADIRFALHFEVRQPTDTFRAMEFKREAIRCARSAGPEIHPQRCSAPKRINWVVF